MKIYVSQGSDGYNSNVIIKSENLYFIFYNLIFWSRHFDRLHSPIVTHDIILSRLNIAIGHSKFSHNLMLFINGVKFRGNYEIIIFSEQLIGDFCVASKFKFEA